MSRSIKRRLFAVISGATVVASGCGSGESSSPTTAKPASTVASTTPSSDPTRRPRSASSDGTNPDGTSPDADFSVQTRVDDGLGVYVSVGGVVQRVDAAAPGTRHKYPVWTTDGSQVAFVAEGEWDAQGAVVRGSEVWVVDPTGENVAPLITCDCWDLNNAAWSPDGRQVAYVEYDAPGPAGPPAASRIVVLDLTTKQRTVVVESEPGQLVDIPRWSPCGRSLVVSIDRFDDTGNETGPSFWILPSAGGGALTPMLPFEDYAYAADWNWVSGALVYSVESQEFAVRDPQVSPWDLFEIQPYGTGRRTITDATSPAPCWAQCSSSNSARAQSSNHCSYLRRVQRLSMASRQGS